MFIFLYRASDNIVSEDLQKARATLGSSESTRCWISPAGDIGIVWTTGALLTENGNEEPLLGQSFALAHGRLDVRDQYFHPVNNTSSFCDSQRIAACALAKGEAAPVHLFGEYGFACWTGRKLFIATDHLGYEGMYYARTPQGFVVATRMTTLLSLPDTPHELDSFGLALVAMVQMGRGAGHTAFSRIQRLSCDKSDFKRVRRVNLG